MPGQGDILEDKLLSRRAQGMKASLNHATGACMNKWEQPRSSALMSIFQRNEKHYLMLTQGVSRMGGPGILKTNHTGDFDFALSGFRQVSEPR